LPSPPPISLVAGRGDTFLHLNHHVQSANYSGDINLKNSVPVSGNPSNFGPGSHSIKPLSSGPLEPINLNPQASWPKVNTYAPLNFSSNSSTLSRSHYEVYTSAPTRPSPPTLTQFPSHYAPINGFRDAGSPPHVSPPLTHEPAYPVLRIEENHRSRMMSPSDRTNYHDEVSMSRGMPLDMFSRHHHSHNHHHHQDCRSHPADQKESYGFQLSPNTLPEHSDSVNSHESGNSQNREAHSLKSEANIVPTNVNGSVRYQCPDCNKSYSTFSGLSKHLQFHCASQNKKSFICKFCEKVYLSLGALKMHIRTHTLPCKCNLCGKAFSRPWLLQGHIRTHTGEKPFTCQHCNRAFADRSNLRAHLQTHSEVKKYSCKSCSKTFSRMSLLVKHEEGGCTSSSFSSTE